MLHDLIWHPWYVMAGFMFAYTMAKFALIKIQDGKIGPISWLATIAIIPISMIWAGALGYAVQHGDPAVDSFDANWWYVAAMILGIVFAKFINRSDVNLGRYSAEDLKRWDKRQNTGLIVILTLLTMTGAPYLGKDVWEAVLGFALAIVAFGVVGYIDFKNHEEIEVGVTQPTY